MTTDPRLEALVEKAMSCVVPSTMGPTGLLRQAFAAILAEAMEAGAWVTCPTCTGHQTVYEKDASERICPTCICTGRIRRELAGALWVLNNDENNDDIGTLLERAREKWGEKQPLDALHRRTEA